ncbi:MAG: hypothetical protein ACM3UO_00575 [Bacillota bacterium]
MRRRTALAAALGAALAAAHLGLAAPVAAASSATTTLSRSATYTCQYSGLESTIQVPGGLPAPALPSLGGTDDVKVEVHLAAPARVSVGDTLRLHGTAVFTFGPAATITNLSTAFRLSSDTFGVQVSLGSTSRLLRVERLTSTTSRSGPIPGTSVVTTTWQLPDYLVPTTTNSTLSFALPTAPLVTNPVGTDPASVTFAAGLTSNSAVQPSRTAACTLDRHQRTALGRAVIVPSPAPTPAPTKSIGIAAPAALGPPPLALGAPTAAKVVAAPSVVRAARPALSAAPIPAATARSGVAVSGWGLAGIIAFAGGGLLLAAAALLRPRRLLARLTGRTALAVTVAAAAPLSVIGGMPPPRADAAGGQAQVTLGCVYERVGTDPSDKQLTEPTGVSISLNLPGVVHPGDVVALTGSASVQAPEEIRAEAAKLAYSELDVVSTSFSTGLTLGAGGRHILPADRWQTGRTQISNPLVVTAPLYFPAFRVPTDATSITLDLPHNDVVPRLPAPYSNAETPPRLALELYATASGNGTTVRYIVSCWRTDRSAGVIATIPVRARPDVASATTRRPDQTAGPTAASAATASRAPVSAGAHPGAQKQHGMPEAAPSDAAPLLHSAAGSTQPSRGGLVVPGWLLISLIGGGAGLYLVAGYLWLRRHSALD